MLFRFRELMAGRAADLARMITAEHGKTFEDARGEVQRGLEVVEFACGAAHLLKGEASEAVGTGVDSHSLRQPIGVAAGITPFNFPAMVPMWMFPLALACGNAFILKPSEKDPSASLLMAEWLDRGRAARRRVQRACTAAGETVEALLRHPGIASISFVGSTPVAKFIYETATAHGKRVQALGGAKNHAVVMPDADVEIAADAIASAGYGSAGQRCMAISAVVAVGAAGDALAEALEARVDALNVGPGAEADGQMGPLVTDAARDRVRGGDRDRGEQEGAELRRDGRGLSVEGHEDGFWVGPTLIDRVTPEMSVYREEIFGPVLVLLRADTSRRRWSWSTRTRTATAPRSSPRTAAPRASSSSACRRAWSASTCRSRCRWPTTRSAAGSSRCSATCTCTGARACSSTRAGRWSRSAGPTRRAAPIADSRRIAEFAARSWRVVMAAIAVALTGCGTPPADLLAVERSGADTNANVEVVVSDGGSVSCNGKEHPLDAERLLPRASSCATSRRRPSSASSYRPARAPTSPTE